MFYDYSFTIPANTPKYPIYPLTATLAHGVIHHVEIYFPKGCAGLVHLRIKKAAHQVWPLNSDGDFTADGLPIAWNDHYELFDRPYAFTLHGWNLDDTFKHTIEIRFAVLPQRIILPEETFIAAFKKLLARLRL